MEKCEKDKFEKKRKPEEKILKLKKNKTDM